MVRTFLQHVDVLVVTVFETDVLFFHVSFTFSLPHSFYLVTVTNVCWANTSLAKRALRAQLDNITMFEETNVVSVKRDCTKVNLVKLHAFLAYLASIQTPKERVNANYVLPIPFLMQWRHKIVKNVTKTRVNFHLKVIRVGTYIFTTC